MSAFRNNMNVCIKLVNAFGVISLFPYNKYEDKNNYSLDYFLFTFVLLIWGNKKAHTHTQTVSGPMFPS